MPTNRWESDVSSSDSPEVAASTWESDSDSDDSFDGNISDDDGELDVPDLEYESDSDDDAPPISPVDELITFLIELVLVRALNARQFCVIMYWIGRCGVEKCKKFGLQPGRQSGKYNRKVKRAVGLGGAKGSYYVLPTPFHSKQSMLRGIRPLPVAVPHEQIMEDIAHDTLSKLNESVENGTLPKCYYENPIVKANPFERILPLVLYLDGLPYSQLDSVIGFWLCNYITGKRYLIGVLRKRCLCKCGCRGWCSLAPIFAFLAWSLIAMSLKTFPDFRHDGSALDPTRLQLAGSVMAIRAILMYIKGDWAEYAQSLGFPTWQSNVRPCFLCNAVGDLMCLHSGAGLHNWPPELRENEDDDYYESCDRCEIHIVLARCTLTLLLNVGKLWQDKRADGNKGRCLSADVPSLGLRRGDRLEPSVAVMDVFALERIVSFPFPIVFWRSSMETVCRHRNPIFIRELGLSPYKVLTIDLLHCLFLSILNAFCQYVILFLLECGTWGPYGSETQRETSILIFKAALFQWYKDRHKLDSKENLTRLSDFTKSMLGEDDGGKLKTKGAETWGVLLFLVDTLVARAARLPAEGGILCESAIIIMELVTLFDTRGVNLTDAEQCLAWSKYKRFLTLTHAYSFPIPKRHLFLHLLRRLWWFGNPRYYATWHDEALNKLLKSCCRQVSQITFEKTVVENVQRILDLQKRRRLQ